MMGGYGVGNLATWATGDLRRTPQTAHYQRTAGVRPYPELLNAK